jgi:trk system potassium uptake protein TrkA
MFVIVAGGGKVGSNVARSLMASGHEVTLIEQRPFRFERLEEEFEHRAIRGDATELYVLERAGIERPPDVVVASTGDDEDNIVICQVARERYGVEKVIARVNNPKNQQHFDLLGISPTVSAVSSVMAMIEHEVPEHGLIQLLQLRKEDLEIVEVQVDGSSPCVGKKVAELGLPDGSTVIAVMRGGKAEAPDHAKELAAGDQVLAVLRRGKEDELRKLLLRS